MKRYKTISTKTFRSERALEKYLHSKSIDPAWGEKLQASSNCHWWEGEILSDSPVLRGLKKYIDGERIVYTQEEILAAELLQFEISDMVSKGDTGPHLGTEYDFSGACEVCLSGAKITSALRVLKEDLPRKRLVAETHVGEFLVGGQLADDLGCLSGAGEWLTDVEDRKTSDTLPWKYLSPVFELPPLDKSTRGFEQYISKKDIGAACRVCYRDCYSNFGMGFEPVYRRSEVADAFKDRLPFGSQGMPDIAGSYELLGPGTRSISCRPRIAQPMIMVSQRVARILMKHASKWIRLTPVTLLDD